MSYDTVHLTFPLSQAEKYENLSLSNYHHLFMICCIIEELRSIFVEGGKGLAISSSPVWLTVGALGMGEKRPTASNEIRNGLGGRRTTSLILETSKEDFRSNE